jgi:hypothetical protein
VGNSRIPDLAPLLLFLLMLISDYRNYAVMAAVSVLVAVGGMASFLEGAYFELPMGPLRRCLLTTAGRRG